VFNIVGGTKGIESSAEFGAIICTNATGVAEQLEYFLANSVGDGGTTLIIDEGENAELAETTDGTEHMYGVGTIA
jgi:hypothetical protein